MSDVSTRVHRHRGHGERGTLTFERVQDVEPILDNNKRLQNEGQSSKSDLRHIASIPNVIIEKWLNEERARGNLTIQMFGEEFDALVKRKLADPDNRYLRTDAKRL